MARRKITNSQAVSITLLWGILCYMMLAYSEKITFDIVFANINRNILLNDIRHYSECMKPGAFLYMSGFYVQDIPAIEEECKHNGLALLSHTEKNNWAAVKVQKQ